MNIKPPPPTQGKQCIDRATPVVAEQIKRGGVRLATVLNQMTARVKRNLGSALRSRTPERQNHELEMRLDSLLNARLKVAGDEFMPANYYLEKWG